jgi:dolichol-phosphate mannosyltransferase
MRDDLVAIILPMYNEAESIPALQRMFKEIPLPPGYSPLIIIVNDGSSDNTLELATKWVLAGSRAIIVSHTQNRGLGEAIITGFTEAMKARATCIVTMDADATHPGNIIAELVTKIGAGADIAIASRYIKGGGQDGVPFLRSFLSIGAKMFYRLAFPLRGVTDYTINFRAYRSSLVSQALATGKWPFLASRSFSATVELLLKLAPFAGTIEEVPFTVRYGAKKSASKLKILATVYGSLRLLFLPKRRCPLGRGLRIS